VVDAPTVFISYAHESAEHEAAVQRLHDLLRAGGVEAVLDRYLTGPGVHWPDWMTEQIGDSDFVLVIASATYGRQADEGVAVEDIRGRGTWFEARLLGDLVYRDGGRESLRRILPVLLPGGSVEDIPPYFAPYGGTYFRVRQLDQAGVANLLRVLRREPGALPVPVGSTAATADFEPLRHTVSIDVWVTPAGSGSRPLPPEYAVASLSSRMDRMARPILIVDPAGRGVSDG
jgi:TIR domain-containing protein